MLRSCLSATLFGLGALAAQAQAAPALPADLCRTECFYRLTYRPDSTNSTTRTDLMRLQIGSKLSRFESRNAVYRDSVTHAEFEQAMHASAGGELPTAEIRNNPGDLLRASMTAVIYKVPSARQVAVYDKVSSISYVYQEPAELLTWTINPDRATVAGYACQRATTTLGGRTWEAWFTREVPVAEGPYKFYGLPGLIVKVSDTRQAYSFELMQLQQVLTPVGIAPPVAAQPTTRAAFRQAKADNDHSSLARLLASGNIRFGSPEEEAAAKRQMQENARKRNNPLELR